MGNSKGSLGKMSHGTVYTLKMAEVDEELKKLRTN